MKVNKLAIFDFDHTLFETHHMYDGKKEWFKKTNEHWPHNSWWDQPDSLNFNILDIRPKKNIISDLIKYFNEKNTYTILLSGRPIGKSNRMYTAIKKILKQHNINKFDNILLNQLDRLDLDFKFDELNKIAKQFSTVTECVFYDDKYDYYPIFQKWGISNFGTNFEQHLVA